MTIPRPMTWWSHWPVNFDRNHLKKLLRESQLNIKLDLNNGKAGAKGWGTDLTTDYVLFNSVYTT